MSDTDDGKSMAEDVELLSDDDRTTIPYAAIENESPAASCVAIVSYDRSGARSASEPSSSFQTPPAKRQRVEVEEPDEPPANPYAVGSFEYWLEELSLYAAIDGDNLGTPIWQSKKLLNKLDASQRDILATRLQLVDHAKVLAHKTVGCKLDSELIGAWKEVRKV